LLAAFFWTKSLLCNVAAFTGMLLYPESTLQLCSSRRFYEVFKEVYFGSLLAVRTTWSPVRTMWSPVRTMWSLVRTTWSPVRTTWSPVRTTWSPVQTTWYSVQTLFCQSIIRPDDENFPSRRPSVSRSFEQFKIASVQT